MPKTFLFERVAIVGVGLIGGSIGLAIRRKGLAKKVVGYARPPDAVTAQALGLVDEAAGSAAEAATNADLIIIASPVTTIPSVFDEIVGSIAPGALITDCASTKSSVIAAARRTLGDAFDRYVPGHPIAGSELSGPAAARQALFDGKRWLFSPVTDGQRANLDRLMQLTERIGARPAVLQAELHDAMFGEYSHAPHALVYAVCLAVANGPHADALADLAGAGFRDTTRIGASSPPLWTDILVDNAAPTVASLDRISESLASVREALVKGDRSALQSMIEQASTWRAQLESDS